MRHPYHPFESVPRSAKLHGSVKKKKVVVFAGTRPEVIKIAPVVWALKGRPEYFEVSLCSTGQHKEMLAQALADFDLHPDIDLGVMSAQQTLPGLSSALFLSIAEFFNDHKPDLVLLQGDTTSVQVASLCSFYAGIPVGHIEAGLRTGDINTPFPEELNRRITSMVARWHFTPTELSRANLINDQVPLERIFLTGNTIVDSLFWIQQDIKRHSPLLPLRIEQAIGEGRQIILVTGHRRENAGQGIHDICTALLSLARSLPEARIVYPVHLNPNVQGPVFELLGDTSNIYLEAPMGHKSFVRLMQSCRLIISDSGGIQEEGPSLGKPVLVTRDSTERPEGIESGVNMLVGTAPARIASETLRLMSDDAAYELMSSKINPFGDGHASERIVDCLQQAFFPAGMVSK